MSLRALGWLAAAAIILWVFILGVLVPAAAQLISKALEVLP